MGELMIIPARKTILLMLLLSALMMPWPRQSGATDTDTLGGTGGVQFRDVCAPGSYLIGVAGRTGQWVDQIRPICAPWLPAQHVFGPPSIGQPHGTSTGGNPTDQRCPGTFAINKWTAFTLTSENRLIRLLDLNCTSVEPSADMNRALSFGKASDGLGFFDASFGLNVNHVCPAGELAVGFQGRAGLFLDAIGLVCGPRPSKPGVITPSPANTPPSALPTAPTITLPQGFIVKGKGIFKIAPSQYLTGTSAQIQLRWLNPPANLQGKGVDFYNYEVPMNLIAGPSGIAAPENYLAQGTWELRVRINQPKVGEWSLPVRFEYYLQNPAAGPNTDVQFGVEGQKKGGTTGSGTSVFRPQTTPSQGLGAGTGIMRRGVEDQPAEQEIPSAETEKKP
jgi:hypothetical protein